MSSVRGPPLLVLFDWLAKDSAVAVGLPAFGVAAGNLVLMTLREEA